MEHWGSPTTLTLVQRLRWMPPCAFEVSNRRPFSTVVIYACVARQPEHHNFRVVTEVVCACSVFSGACPAVGLS